MIKFNESRPTTYPFGLDKEKVVAHLTSIIDGLQDDSIVLKSVKEDFFYSGEDFTETTFRITYVEKLSGEEG